MKRENSFRIRGERGGSAAAWSVAAQGEIPARTVQFLQLRQLAEIDRLGRIGRPWCLVIQNHKKGFSLRAVEGEEEEEGREEGVHHSRAPEYNALLLHPCTLCVCVTQGAQSCHVQTLLEEAVLGGRKSKACQPAATK